MIKYLRKYIDIFPNSNRLTVFCAILAVFTLMADNSFVFAQKTQENYVKYIKKYKKIAVEHRKKYGIPASITIAQGLLESQAGQSRLATEGNNHFGIKCGSGWNGKTIRHDDDRRQECFRKYKNAEQSYEDHARFLKRKRYEPLFKHKVTDYKSWARTLRKCGYATDPKYPDKLIDLIERYELYRYDKGKVDDEPEEEFNVDKELQLLEGSVVAHAVHQRGNLFFVRTRQGDTYKSIAEEFDIKEKKLKSFNDIKDDESLKAGSVVYLQEKNKKYDGDEESYTVKDGETLYSISQELGIRLKELCKMNKLKEHSEIKKGATLRIR